MSDTFERLKEIIVYRSGIYAELVTPQASFADLGFDSLDLIELVMATEDHFVAFAFVDDEVLEQIKTVQDAVSAIDAGFSKGAA